MTLVDAGPLIAIIDSGDSSHRACTNAVANLPLPLVAPWPVIAEAAHLLGSRCGWPGQESLLKLLIREQLIGEGLDAQGLRRAFDLMRKYRSVPMDLGDAALVVLAERSSVRRIFTLDSDFLIYRLNGRTAVDVILSPGKPRR